jgi:hypothetical protein
MSNLHLSVINDGTVYSQRCTFARRFVGYPGVSEHVAALRPICTEQAKKERREFGSKFSSADVLHCAHEVAAYDRARWLDELQSKMKQPGAIVHVQGRAWFDRINGNTYHSCRIDLGPIGVQESVFLPMEYGYGDQWQQTARDWLIKYGLIPDPGRYENGMRKRSDFPILWGDCAYGNKRDLYA